jgi:3-oxoacyl-[acyl-carrier protein] reductase
MKDKVVLVTGGGSGFGAEIGRRMAAEGAKVVLSDINADNGEAVASEIGDEARFIHGDVSKGDDVKAMVDAAVDGFGRLDVMINNAGFTHHNQPMLDVDEATFDKVYAVNVKSIYWAAQHAVPVFRKQGGGQFVNIASTAGVRPRPGLTWYNGSKAAVILLTRSMAVELAPDKIRVNAVNPVMGDTAMLDAFMGGRTPEKEEKFVSTIPLGRMSQPKDVANAVLYLSEDESNFLTGVCLDVDGGRTI